MIRFISAQNQIDMYMHCGKCMIENPTSISPKDFQQVQVGFTKIGIQVWCIRHNINIVHIDFEGQVHPANSSPTDPTIQSILKEYEVTNESTNNYND